MKNIELLGNFGNRDFLSPRIRLAFVQKVYVIVSIQTLITGIFVYFAQTSTSAFHLNNTTNWVLFFISTLVILITTIMLHCYVEIVKAVPTNYFLLGLFTLSEAYTVACSTTFFPKFDVNLAALLTFTMTLILTIYAFTTKTDFTILGGFMWILGWGLIALIILFFLTFSNNYRMMNYFDIFLTVCVICICGFYIVYDTQMILGSYRLKIGVDDYIIASMALYIDIITLFTNLLRVISRPKQ